MNSRDRLTRLTADVVAAAPSTDPASPGSPPEPPPFAAPARQLETRFPEAPVGRAGKRTGPGELLAFRGQMLAAEGELSKLRDQLREYDGSLPARKLDPKLVVPSRWANRHEAAFASAEFLRFKADIEHAGGNVQPILVRPAGDTGNYELVFGHRRHRACLELGLPVLAVVHTGPMGEVDLFSAMERENRERADLSPWEQGRMYRNALDQGLFGSQRKLAETLGVSHTWVRKALAVADLPEAIVQCFSSPLEVQFRHADEIGKALEADQRGVLRRAEKLRQSSRLSASSVVATLVGKRRGDGRAPRDLKVGDRTVGRLTWDERGQAVIRVAAGAIGDENVDRVLTALSAALAEA